jgi:hypothetical protein
VVACSAPEAKRGSGDPGMAAALDVHDEQQWRSSRRERHRHRPDLRAQVENTQRM